MTDHGQCPPADAADRSAGVELAQRYAKALDDVFGLMRDQRKLSRDDPNYTEDLVWEIFTNRLEYPAFYRLSKRRMAELLSAAVVLLTCGPDSEPADQQS